LEILLNIQQNSNREPKIQQNLFYHKKNIINKNNKITPIYIQNKIKVYIFRYKHQSITRKQNLKFGAHNSSKTKGCSKHKKKTEARAETVKYKDHKGKTWA